MGLTVEPLAWDSEFFGRADLNGLDDSDLTKLDEAQ
jgi:hypothetical protein